MIKNIVKGAIAVAVVTGIAFAAYIAYNELAG